LRVQKGMSSYFFTSDAFLYLVLTLSHCSDIISWWSGDGTIDGMLKSEEG